jgi:nicotinamide mononucleotide transporter
MGASAVLPNWPGKIAYLAAALLSVALLVADWRELVTVPLDKTELLAFVSGAWTVWLAMRNNVWSWPIGVLNSAFFVALFWQSRLYFDMSLNVFYVLSGLWGWWTWAHGGEDRTEKPIGRASRLELSLIVLTGGVLTVAMWQGGLLINDASPFLDALTTALSLGAQWLLMRRLLQNWFFWIAADLIYIPLYLSRDLPLTAVLYGLFLLMCLRGVVEWKAIMGRERLALQGASG